jgi:polyhydroxybutyrate depolymerase
VARDLNSENTKMRSALSSSLVVFAMVFIPRPALHAAEGTDAAVEKTITVDGLPREYLHFVPNGAKEPMPVVFMLHGGGGKARGAERFTHFSELAQKEGFVVIYPQGVEGHWNDGRGVEIMRAQRENIDDVKFLRAVLADVAAGHNIDRGRVFATGISNGGFMVHRLAAEAADVMAAIAPVVGGMAPAIAEKFKPRQPVSILIIQGEADPIVPLNGGDVSFAGGASRGKLLATSDTLAKYLERNGNQGDPVSTTIDQNSRNSVEMKKYPDGPGGVKTSFYLVKNGGHTWFGAASQRATGAGGRGNQDFRATAAIWDFFKSCPPRAPAATEK